MCEDNVCGRYKKSWACPPAIGTLEECEARCLSYSHMLVFNQVFALDDSFDYPGMLNGMEQFGHICHNINTLAKQYFTDYFLLGNEGCNTCGTCTYPDAPCRFPDQLHPALEGMGLYVYKLAEQAGMNYINGKNTVTYFGGLLFHEEDTAVPGNKITPSGEEASV